MSKPKVYDPLPKLVIEYPRCGNCACTVEMEDGVATCPSCLIHWNDISEDAEPEIDPYAELSGEICGAKPKSSTLRHVGVEVMPCSLPAEHIKEHHYPWKDRP